MRQFLLFLSIGIVGILYITRLFYLQVITSEDYSLYDDNAIRKVIDFPQRGHIFDRHGNLLVSNQPSYDLMVVPRELKPIDTLEFCKLLKITKNDLLVRLEKATNYSPRLPSVFIPHLSKEDYAAFQEKLRSYEGFYIQKRSLRLYERNIGANVLGDIGEVSSVTAKEENFYTQGDLIGKQGIELSYEEELRGVKGIKFIQKDRFNKDIGPYKNGTFDVASKKGNDIYTTIDSELQEYGELLMQNKRGGIIALEPSTGEILSMITAPSYDPNILVGRKRSENYNKLHADSIAKPLYDRSLLAQYAPGSPFKVINALIALQENVVELDDHFSCNLGYYYGGRKMGCHSHPSPVDLNLAIYESCNAYFANVYRKIIDKYDSTYDGMNVWSNHVKSFGLGDYLGYDLKIGSPGRIPNGDFYNKWYGNGKWYSTFMLSNAIGQGEIEATPIQLANMTAAIANRGYFFTPHIIKSIEGGKIDTTYTTAKYTSIASAHFGPIVEGMHDVYKKGTAEHLQVKDIEICGKTGTAENYAIIEGKRTQLTDHSIFIAFAPKDNPKIALAVFVENGYWGGRNAGRIASLMIEKYLKGEISNTAMEDWVLNNSLEEEYAKPLSGKPFKINQ